MAVPGTLDGKVALVTGSGRGIGRGIALLFAEAGADIIVADLDEGRSNSTANEVRAIGRQAIALVGDVSSKSDCQRWIDEATARMGRLDILVNNAAWRTRHPFVDFPEDVMDRTIAICLKGPFLCSQAAAREMMKQRSGRIINISSVVADRATVETAAYAAAKGGVNALTYLMALELAPYGITVNAIAPGTTETPHLKADKGETETRDRLRRTPLGRLGHPDDIAGAALYLASDIACWVTGTVLRVDGGFCAGGVFPEPV